PGRGPDLPFHRGVEKRQVIGSKRMRQAPQSNRSSHEREAHKIQAEYATSWEARLPHLEERRHELEGFRKPAIPLLGPFLQASRIVRSEQGQLAAELPIDSERHGY